MANDPDLFDGLIERLPERLLAVPGALRTNFEDLPLASSPHTIFCDIRDRFGPVVEVVDGKIDGLVFPEAVGWEKDRRVFLVLGYDAAAEYAKASVDTLSIEMAMPSAAKTWGRVLGFIEGPDHLRMRHALEKNVFGRKRIAERADELLRPAAEYLVDRLARRIAAGKPCDARRDLALPMVYKPVSRLIGVPEEEFDYFMPLCDSAFAAPWDIEAAGKAARELGEFFQGQLEERRRCPAEDMMSRLLHNDDPRLAMSDNEIVDHARFLLPAGLDTTRYTTVNMIAAMLMHPDQYQEVAENPDLVGNAVEECMRWLPSNIVGGTRVAHSDTVVAGVPIPKGSYCGTVFSALNRDPKYWDDPHRFDIHRKQPVPHMTFLAGRHYCVGQNLARQVMNTLLRTLVERLPTLRLAIDPAAMKIRGIPLSGPVTIPLRN